jgi:HTH-type transcriptional regulator / antitoxin HigA
MSTTTIDLDTKRYGKLLAKARPAVIKSEEENDRMLAIVEELMAKGEDRLSAEEDALLELLLDLVHSYEQKQYSLPVSPPYQMVAFLLEQRRLEPNDLWPLLGSKGRVSEVLSGKRSISKDQAKKLASFFHVRADLFI